MLPIGVGKIEWNGDDRLSILGLLVVGAICISYWLEVRWQAMSAEEKLDCSTFSDDGMDEEYGDVPLSAEEGQQLKAAKPAQQKEEKAPVSYASALASAASVLVCSVSLIYTNAWILRGFPYVCTYVTVQQAVCFLAASIAVKCCKVVEITTLSWDVYLSRVAPLGVCFTLYLWGSNTAYRYLEPGLIQMLKSIGSCFVFTLACFFGVETFSKAKALNFIYISIGTVLTALPQLLEMRAGHHHSSSPPKNSLESSSSSDIFFGVAVLMGAYFCDAYYVVSIQRLAEGDLVAKCFGPLAILMYVSPIVTICLGTVSFFVEREAWTHLSDIGIPLLALASLLAFAFNIAVLNFIGRLSATSYVIFDYFKDITILSFAFLVFSENFTRNELIGYAVVLAGASVWQHRKLSNSNQSTAYKLLQQNADLDLDQNSNHGHHRQDILLDKSNSRRGADNNGALSPPPGSEVRERTASVCDDDDEQGLMLVSIGAGGIPSVSSGASANKHSNTSGSSGPQGRSTPTSPSFGNALSSNNGSQSLTTQAPLAAALGGGGAHGRGEQQRHYRQD